MSHHFPFYHHFSFSPPDFCSYFQRVRDVAPYSFTVDSILFDLTKKKASSLTRIALLLLLLSAIFSPSSASFLCCLFQFKTVSNFFSSHNTMFAAHPTFDNF